VRRALLIATLVFVIPTAAFGQVTGVERLTDLWSLPELTPGVVAFGESSHDLLGLNEDGFLGLFSRLYREGGKDVLFDGEGPGCVYRLWFTFSLPAPYTRLQFYLDNAEQPTVDVNIHDFFAGQTPPFLQPLVWDDSRSSGGFVSYAPVCYRERLKIVTTTGITFYNVTAHRYRADTEVTSFAGDEDYTAVDALYDPDRAGADPKDTTGVDYAALPLTLAPGETAPIFAEEGAGQIASVRLTPAAIDEALLNNVRLRATFDGANDPAVDVQLGMFCGATAPGFEVAALLFGIKDGVLYSFFPMPYFDGARLELVNESAATVSLQAEVGVRREPPDDYAATFTTVSRLGAPTVLMGDHHFADPTGQGKIVGVIQLAGGYSGQGYLEGDERWYPDGLLTPTIQGTGTEDYYNGGWYFKYGMFTLPTHGHQMRLDDAGLDVTGMYRLHVGDSLEFYRGATFSIEHDALNLDTDEVYRTTAFVYRVNEDALIPEAEFDVGQSLDEARFQYHGSDDQPTGPQLFFYEGDQDLAPYDDGGYQSRGEVSFTLPVNPFNDGVRLVRRLDQLHGRDLVRVLVDGADAGLWRTPEHNPFKRWRDTVFDLPPALTKGKSSLSITLVNASGADGFSQYHYWIYSWKRPLISRMRDLVLSSPATQLTIGDAVQLFVDGGYPSGHREEVTGWVDYELSDARLATIAYGRLKTKTAGELKVKAIWGDRESNEITINIIPPASGADDDLVDDDFIDDDAAIPPASTGDDESGCGC
jgi:hypothetical protein